MKPEPSPFSIDGEPSPGAPPLGPPGPPGAGMPKRRKNSPSGFWSEVVLPTRTDTTFTTALPFASTSALKSGNPRTVPFDELLVAVLAGAVCTAFPEFCECEHDPSAAAMRSALHGTRIG